MSLDGCGIAFWVYISSTIIGHLIAQFEDGDVGDTWSNNTPDGSETFGVPFCSADGKFVAVFEISTGTSMWLISLWGGRVLLPRCARASCPPPRTFKELE